MTHSLQLERSRATPRPNDKARVREFYDVVSSHFHDLWGEHIHHGYWIHGNEAKETAQIQLIEHLAQIANIRPGQTILDAGCGTGASSVYLARQYNVEATGITISPVQVDLANQAAAKAGVSSTFLLMDAEAMNFHKSFDVVWSVESISHYYDIANFFVDAVKLLRPGGTIAVVDWFKREDLNPAEYKRYILPIEKGMFNELRTMQEYETWMKSCGLQIIKSEILNKNCAKTWDLGLDIIKKRSVWKLAATHGAMFVNFLRAFRAMRSGFASEKFVYGLVVAQKT